MLVETDDATELDWTAVATAFRTGDAAAADAIARQVAPFVAALVRRLTAWHGDVDDLVQDSLVAALAARRQFRGDAKLETWITRITVNQCRAHARKLWVRKNLFRSWAAKAPAAAEAPADASAIAGEQAAIVRQAVAQLSPKYREAIVLCYLQNLTLAEAAAALGVRRGTVEVRLSRARDQLRNLLTS